MSPLIDFKVHKSVTNQDYIKYNFVKIIEDIHNSWLYCFINPLELSEAI